VNTVIVQIVQHLRPGGIETMALDLLNQLSNKADVYIFSLEGSYEEAVKEWPRLEKYHSQLKFFHKKGGITPRLFLRLKAALKEINATAIHTHHIGPLLYGGVAAKLLKLPHVHTEHDAWHLNASANKRLQNHLINFLKFTLVADCEAVANELLHHFPNSRPDIIQNGVDTNHFCPATPTEKLKSRKRLNLPVQGTLLGCAARLEAVKGHELLLKSLSHTHTNLSLVLAGDGSLLNHLKNVAFELGISDRVFFLGHLDDTLPFYHAIDIFCLSSLNEGLPLSPLEAQACGVPVIVTDVGGCKTIVCPDSGDLIPPGSRVALQHAILRQYLMPKRHSPREFVLKKGNLHKTADAYFQLLSQPKEA